MLDAAVMSDRAVWLAHSSCQGIIGVRLLTKNLAPLTLCAIVCIQFRFRNKHRGSSKAIDCERFAMVKMSDIARAANVSTTTVSHVLNESRFVREETRVRVLEAIADLGYRPNAMARGLRRKESQTIGFIVPDLANPFFAEIGKGLEQASFENGYNVIFSHTNGVPASERKVLSSLLEKQVDGIVVASTDPSPDRIIELSGSRVPAVLVDRDCEGFRGDIVLSDNASGGKQVVEHLVSLGHSRIACVAASAASRPSALGRLSGFKSAMERAGLDYEDHVLIAERVGSVTGSEIRDGYLATKALLARPMPPTAIFMTNDLMAIGALRAVVERGMRVPDDLSIAGFDDIALAQYTNPSLTTVVQPRQETGRIAARLLMQRIKDKSRDRERVLLDVSLIVRESTSGVQA